MSFNRHSIVIDRHSIVRLIHSSIHTTILIISFIILSGCSKEDRVAEEKMVLIYTDLLIAQDTTLGNITNTDSLITSVLKKHNVSNDKYEKTIEYYNQDVKRWEAFFDKVTAHIDSLSHKPR